MNSDAPILPYTDTSSPSFTLIELIVVIAILSIVSVITISYVISATRTYIEVSAQSDVDEEAVAALNRIRREIRILQTTVIADSNVLEFVSRYGTTNMIQLSSGEVTLNGYCLAGDVDVFRLRYFNVTNGEFSTPLSLTNMVFISRIALDFRITRDSRSSDLNVNLFYPRSGVLK